MWRVKTLIPVFYCWVACCLTDPTWCPLECVNFEHSLFHCKATCSFQPLKVLSFVDLFVHFVGHNTVSLDFPKDFIYRTGRTRLSTGLSMVDSSPPGAEKLAEFFQSTDRQITPELTEILEVVATTGKVWWVFAWLC